MSAELLRTYVVTDGWTNGLKDRRCYQLTIMLPIPYYYNGYNESTVANVCTHYNDTTCYTPFTKTT